MIIEDNIYTFQTSHEEQVAKSTLPPLIVAVEWWSSGSPVVFNLSTIRRDYHYTVRKYHSTYCQFVDGLN